MAISPYIEQLSLDASVHLYEQKDAFKVVNSAKKPPIAPMMVHIECV